MAKNEEARGPEKKGSWLTYRPDIKILDCTIRDGGLMNNSRFDDDFVQRNEPEGIADGYRGRQSDQDV